MTEKTPLRIRYDGNGNPIGLAEFQSGEFVPGAVPAGTILLLPTDFNNSDYLLCDGSVISTDTYPALADVLPEPVDGFQDSGRAHDSGKDFFVVVYDNAKFFVNGSGVAPASSTDGITWTDRPQQNYAAYGMVWDGSQYVAVGYGGRAWTMPSDFSAWTERTTPTSEHLHAIAYDGSTLVAVGNNGACMTSTDGITWTDRSTVGDGIQDLRKCRYLNGDFYALDWSDSLFDSSDGITWNETTLPDSKPYRDIAWNGTVFLAVCRDGEMYTSSDASTWTYQATLSLTGYVLFVKWLSGEFLIGCTYGEIFSSADGTSATDITPTSELTHDPVTEYQFYDAAFDGNNKTALVSQNNFIFYREELESNQRVLPDLTSTVETHEYWIKAA